jgi:hypothetical protein
MSYQETSATDLTVASSLESAHQVPMDASHADHPQPASLQDPLLRQLDDALRQVEPGGDGESGPAGPLSEQDITRVRRAIASYDAYSATEFRQQHDHMRLLGQDNWRRYLPVRELRIRVTEADSAWDILARIAAARAAGCRPTVSSPHGVQDPVLDYLDDLTDPWAGQIEFVEEEDEELASKLQSGETERIRFAAPDRVPEVTAACGGGNRLLSRGCSRGAARARRTAVVRRGAEPFRQLPSVRKSGGSAARDSSRTAVVVGVFHLRFKIKKRQFDEVRPNCRPG